MPFGGHYRLIDFALSNLVNANCRRIVVLAQYKTTAWTATSPRPGDCRPYWATCRFCARPDAPRPALVRRLGGRDPSELQPDQRHERPEHIIVFGADHIYRMDPRQMVEQHAASGAAVTVAAIRAPIEQADQFG